jgi:FMN phosphatase YigB (HAD superfamily)
MRRPVTIPAVQSLASLAGRSLVLVSIGASIGGSTARRGIRFVVFDAMGVLYKAADDVEELLIPYLRERRCRLADNEIAELYRRCSLGEFGSAEFWRRCQVIGSDATYCARHQLAEGMCELLAELMTSGIRLACVSNDVSEGSPCCVTGLVLPGGSRLG